MKKIPIFFFTHSKYRIIFNEWKTTASLFSPAFLFLPMFKAKYSKYSFYIQISSLKQRARLFFPINSTSHEASPAITGGKSRPLEYGNDSFKRMRHGCNNWKKKRKKDLQRFWIKGRICISRWDTHRSTYPHIEKQRRMIRF